MLSTHTAINGSEGHRSFVGLNKIALGVFNGDGTFDCIGCIGTKCGKARLRLAAPRAHWGGRARVAYSVELTRLVLTEAMGPLGGSNRASGIEWTTLVPSKAFLCPLAITASSCGVCALETVTVVCFTAFRLRLEGEADCGNTGEIT